MPKRHQNSITETMIETRPLRHHERNTAAAGGGGGIAAIAAATVDRWIHVERRNIASSGLTDKFYIRSNQRHIYKTFLFLVACMSACHTGKLRCLRMRFNRSKMRRMLLSHSISMQSTSENLSFACRK